MKSLILGLIFLLTIASTGQGRTPSRVTLQDAATTGNGTIANASGYTIIGLQIIENSSGDRVVNFETTVDGTNYKALTCRNVTADTSISTIAASGIVTCNIGGFSKFRARVSGGTTGTVTVYGLMLQNASSTGSSSSGMSASNLANPSGTIGLAAVNGSALTALRSDGAPPLSQAIAPTWTGVHNFSPPASTGTVAPTITYTGAAHTALTASTERLDINWNSARTVEWATGALALQRFHVWQAPTIGFVGASTVTSTCTMCVTGPPVKGTNATLTATHGILVQAGAVSTAAAAYGLTVNTPTGATLNYAASFVGGQTLFADGLVGTPGIAFAGSVGLGFWRNGSNEMTMVAAGSVWRATGGYFNLGPTELAWGSTVAGGSDLRLNRFGAGVLIMGREGDTGPTAQTFRVFGITGTNQNGSVFTLQSGMGTGTGTVSTIKLKAAATAEASGTTVHSPVDHMTIGGGAVILNSAAVTPAASGTRYICIDTTGKLASSASVCSGT